MCLREDARSSWLYDCKRQLLAYLAEMAAKDVSMPTSMENLVPCEWTGGGIG